MHRLNWKLEFKNPSELNEDPLSLELPKINGNLHYV